MKSLGIYFGPKGITIVESESRKLICNIHIPQTMITAGDLLEERVNEEVKIVALINDELRKNRIASRDASIVLSGRDLIIRNFEIPLMPKEELESGIMFEVKRFIPFKVEELISTFQAQLNKASRTNLVLFMGIKKETLDKYVSILNQLNIKINTIEYAAFSMARCLDLAGVSSKGIIGIFAADLKEQDEVNFVVLENGFPLFSRDISLTGVPTGEFIGPEEVDQGSLLEKLKSEIRISLDYYHRKFPSKNIKKISLFSNQDNRSEIEALVNELGLPFQFIDPVKVIGKVSSYSLSVLKSYSASLFRSTKAKLKLDLLAKKQKQVAAKGKDIKPQVTDLIKDLKLDFNMLAVGIFMCILAFAFGLYRTQPLREELNKIRTQRAQIATADPNDKIDTLINMELELRTKIKTMDNIVKKQLFLTEPLNVIPKSIPEGVWLKSFSFSKREDSKSELNLSGMAYLNDSDEEFTAVNRLLLNLRGDPEFNSNFQDISIVSVNRASFEQLTVTNFSISCKNFKN